MSYTPFNAPILSGLLGDPEIVAQFSVQAELDAMLRFEVALAKAEAKAGVIPEEAAAAIETALAGFKPDIKSINQAVAIDGVVVPEFVRQMVAHVGEPHGKHVHFGATSQDVIDTSLILRLVECGRIYKARLRDLVGLLSDLQMVHGKQQLQGRTRMQVALPITVADRIDIWMQPLQTHLHRLDEQEIRLHCLQFGGPVGTLDKLGDKKQAVAQNLEHELGLTAPQKCWHTDRSEIVALANCLSLITGTLGKMGQDIALMAQNEIGEVVLSGGGKSSAMPHKQNPVLAETLVTLAAFNGTQLSAMHQSMVHEQERSGAMWTLEWMVLPQICVATGAAMLRAKSLLGSIEKLGA